MISKKTKYGLKAVSYLSQQEVKKPILISEISKSQNISQKFLESILLELKKKGFLGSKKGKGGGYHLLKPGGEITVAEIFRALEGPIAWLPCVSLNYYEKCDDCQDEEGCSLNRAMIEVRDAILKVVENQTIADL